MSLVLDAGALLAVERADRHVIALIKRELTAGRAPTTHGGVIGQVWRGGAGRQARLAQLLPGVNVAALVLLTEGGDSLLTSDVADIERLVAVADRHVDVVPG